MIPALISILSFLFLILLSINYVFLKKKKLEAVKNAERKKIYLRSLEYIERLLLTSPFKMPLNVQVILLKKRYQLLELIYKIGEKSIAGRLALCEEELARVMQLEPVNSKYPNPNNEIDKMSHQYLTALSRFFESEITKNTWLSLRCTVEKQIIDEVLVQYQFFKLVEKGENEKSLEAWGNARSYFEKALNMFILHPNFTENLTTHKETLLDSITDIQRSMWSVPKSIKDSSIQAGDGLERMFETQKSKEHWQM